MTVKVRMASNHPKIFRASERFPPPKFPFDDKIKDDWSGDEPCPTCNKPLGEHTIREGIRCAYNALKGGN